MTHGRGRNEEQLDPPAPIPERYYGKTPLELIAPGADPAEIDRHRLTIAARKQFHDLEYHWHGPGGDIWLSASGIPVFDDDGGFSGYRGTCRDITDKRRGEERLRHLVHHDDLTGIPNWLLLLDRLGPGARSPPRREGAAPSLRPFSTSTASRTSTTRSATPPATGSSGPSRGRITADHARRRTPWRGSAATSSPFAAA